MAHPLRRHACMGSLSADVHRKIVSHLSFADLCAAREACLFPAGSAGATLLRDAQRAARDALAALRPLVRVRGRAAVRPHASPLTLATWARPLALAPESVGLPEAVGQLRSVASLTVSPALAQLRALPSALAHCTRLRKLCIAGHAFTEIPRAVLALRGIAELDVSRCTMIAVLPPDLGRRLPRLRKFKLVGCGGVRSLPRSLLRALERNCGGDREPLKLGPRLFERGYLRQRISKRRYPKLAARCEEMFTINEEEPEQEEEEN